jgi:hypothetical protein
MFAIGGVWELLLFAVVLTDLFLLGCYLFVKTRNEWRRS